MQFACCFQRSVCNTLSKKYMYMEKKIKIDLATEVWRTDLQHDRKKSNEMLRIWKKCIIRS